jgi:hypothetical protein
VERKFWWYLPCIGGMLDLTSTCTKARAADFALEMMMMAWYGMYTTYVHIGSAVYYQLSTRIQFKP